MTSLREGLNPKIKLNLFIMINNGIKKIHIQKRKLNKLNKKNEYDKSTTTVVCKCDEVLVLLDEYLHIDDQGVE